MLAFGLPTLELRVIAVLMLVISSTTAKPFLQYQPGLFVQGRTTSYYFPYICSLTTHDKNRYTHIGTGSILTTRYIAVSVELMILNQQVVVRQVGCGQDRSQPCFETKQSFRPASSITVYAGIDVPAPGGSVTEYNTDYRQIRRGKEFYAVKSTNYRNSRILTQFAGDVEPDPTSLTGFEVNAFLYPTMDIGILEIFKPFFWSPRVLPVEVPPDMSSLRLQEETIFYALEDHPEGSKPCVIPGWGMTNDQHLVFHELVYVPFDNCREAICQESPKECMKYPIKDQHVCFKPLVHGGPCIKDVGSGVYCSEDDQIVAFLAKTFDCGLRSMPSIFTKSSYVLNIVNIMTNNVRYERREAYSLKVLSEGTEYPPLVTWKSSIDTFEPQMEYDYNNN